MLQDDSGTMYAVSQALRRMEHLRCRKYHERVFYMYPEEALGPGVQSATIMWEHVESLFEKIRELMRKSGRARSGSFSMPWTAACMKFLQV